MAEYDLTPQELALAVAAGHVDLGLEAELLAEPDRRAVALANAAALARAAAWTASTRTAPRVASCSRCSATRRGRGSRPP